MLELPPLGTNSPDSSKGLTADSVDGLAQLLGLSGNAVETDAELLAGMEALLQQLSPELRQRLERLLNGGMDLPQAAKSLLLEGLPEAGGRFNDVLQQRLLDPQRPAGALEMRDAQFSSVGATPRPSETLLTLMASATAGASLPAAIAAVPMPPPGTLSATFSPQLAGNLLEMGIPQPVASRGWDTALADRVTWMLQGDQQFARLRLNPANLGPLEVRVSVQQDQTSVIFVAQHAATREALEAALPRLREMFDQQSLQLVRADVSDPGTRQGEQGRDNGGQHGADGAGAGGDGATADPLQDPMTQANVVNGLIDLFA